ncbi:MAG: Crp/Fnr family transcriptional regulator [Leptospira sp.]|nr:Crp/Fnr family transcriptional regulator [Leptospira sp.]
MVVKSKVIKESKMESPDCGLCPTRNHSILQSANSETLEKINNGKNFGIYAKNSLIFKTGDPATGFYFLKKGLVRSFKQSAGKEQTFHIRGPGDWIGFRDALAGDVYFHSTECLEDVEACFIDKILAQHLIHDDVNFQTEVFRQMAKEWRESETQVVSLGTKQVHSKLAELLLTLKKGSGGSSELELKITREVLASIIGTKTETLVRALTDFKNRDIVRVDKNRIIINNTDALLTLSEIE